MALPRRVWLNLAWADVMSCVPLSIKDLTEVWAHLLIERGRSKKTCLLSMGCCSEAIRIISCGNVIVSKISSCTRVRYAWGCCAVLAVVEASRLPLFAHFFLFFLTNNLLWTQIFLFGLEYPNRHRSTRHWALGSRIRPSAVPFMKNLCLYNRINEGRLPQSWKSNKYSAHMIDGRWRILYAVNLLRWLGKWNISRAPWRNGQDMAWYKKDFWSLKSPYLSF